MAFDIDTVPAQRDGGALPPGFEDRVQQSLANADRGRRNRLLAQRAARLLPLCLLIGPIIGWRLMLASPGGVHVYVNVLTWVTFILDVGVHVDTAVLTYLGFQPLPTIVGFLLFILLTVTLLDRNHVGNR